MTTKTTTTTKKTTKTAATTATKRKARTSAKSASAESAESAAPHGLVAPAFYETDLAYLQDELDWIEHRCRRIAAALRLDKACEASEAPRPGRWRDKSDESPADIERRRAAALAAETRARATIDRRLEVHRAAHPELAFDRVCRTCELDDFERTALLLAAAPCLSLKFDDLFSEIDQHSMSSGLTVESLFAFIELPIAERVGRRRAFGRRGALVSRDLVTADVGNRFSSPKDLLTTSVEITSRAFQLLVGDQSLSEDLVDFSSVEEPKVTLDQVVLPPVDKRRLLAVVERHDAYLECRRAWGFDDVIRYGRGVLMLFHGKPGTGKTMTAHAIAHRLGRRVLNVDIPTFIEHADASRFMPGLFREARLQNALLFFDECELLFASRKHGNALMTLLLTEIERFEGVAILATNMPQMLDEALDRRILVKVRFPEPDREARREIWQRHLPAAAPLAADVDLDALAERFDMAGGYIKNAVLTAVAEAVHDGGEAPQLTMALLERAAHDQIVRPQDGDDEVSVPDVGLADMVLPAPLRAQVTELVAAARNRRTVLERWGIGARLTGGKGVSALFHGEPGTGKTLCAEAVAGELHRPLLTASIPAVVSKWVGETESNLEALFRRARTLGAVLFLDEVDSLLMERGEGRASRHDDSAVNVLLKLVERHEGVVLLATNLPERLDRALDRRITYRLHFPFPAATERAAIWQRLLPATAPGAETVDTYRLGCRFQLAGGHIRNAVYKAAFRAASAGEPLSQALVEHAAREEAEARTGGQARPVGFAVAS